jgi:hypothetical protein
MGKWQQTWGGHASGRAYASQHQQPARHRHIADSKMPSCSSFQSKPKHDARIDPSPIKG